MEEAREHEAIKHGFQLLLIKVIIGGLAAVVAMVVMRVVGNHEVLVALLIGLSPGLAEKSLKKLVYGAILGTAGFIIGGHISAIMAKSIIQEVPLGHWAIVGGFIGITAGILRSSDEGFSFRSAGWSRGGIAAGIIICLIFGFLGDIGGILAIMANQGTLVYYMREVSLLCAGVFINLGAALASMFATWLYNKRARAAAA